MIAHAAYCHFSQYYPELSIRFFSTVESMKKQNTSRSPRNQEKKKFTRDMIGAPQNDLRHTGHIGYDGINFGDIPVGPEKVEKIIPIKGGSSGKPYP